MTAASSYSLLLLCLALLAAMAAAAQFRVGGSTGWAVPSDPNAMSYNQWAQKNRFKIGDSLLFVYQPGSDSVLQVSQEDYSSCRTSSPIKIYSDGNTVVTLDRSGPFYFISGDEKKCLRNESMAVVVLADRTPTVPPPAPPPSPASPPPTPTSPPTAASPPPPPPPSSEVTPSPSPTGAEGSPTTKNGAPLKAMGFMGTVGALLGSLLVL